MINEEFLQQPISKDDELYCNMDDDGVEIIVNEMNSLAFDPNTQLSKEVNQLISKSVDLNLQKVVAMFINGYGLVLVDANEVNVSSQLKNAVWSPEKPAQTQSIAYINYNPVLNVECFNDLLKKRTHVLRDMRGTFAVFGAHYQKIPIIPAKIENFKNHYTTKRNNIIYFYDEFSLLIVKDGQVVDGAIHGNFGNIRALVENYKPQRIIYKSTPGDSLDTFMKCKIQPFYDAFHGLLYPVNCFDNFLTVSYCRRTLNFCSVCRTMQTLIGYAQRPDFQIQQEITPRYNTHTWRNFKNKNRINNRVHAYNKRNDKHSNIVKNMNFNKSV